MCVPLIDSGPSEIVMQYHYTVHDQCDVTSVRAEGHGKPFFSSSLDLDDT